MTDIHQEIQFNLSTHIVVAFLFVMRAACPVNGENVHHLFWWKTFKASHVSLSQDTPKRGIKRASAQEI